MRTGEIVDVQRGGEVCEAKNQRKTRCGHLARASLRFAPPRPADFDFFAFFIVIFFLFLSYSFSSSSSSYRFLLLYVPRVAHTIRRERSLPSVSPLLSTLPPRIPPASTLSNTSIHWRQTSAPAQKIRDKLIDTRRTRTRTLYIPTILVECKTSLKAGAKKRRSSPLCVRVCSSAKGPVLPRSGHAFNAKRGRQTVTRL